MTQRFYNNARGVLTGPVIEIDDTIVLQDHVNLPTTLAAGDWFSLTVLNETSRYGSNLEIMKVTGVTVSGSNLELVVERGQDGTAVVAHDEGEKAEARITRMSILGLLEEASQHTNDAVLALIDSAPGALDTLNELAAALGDDPNFATTVANALADKLPSSAYTAADVLAKLLTVDGSGTGLDADVLRGLTPANLRDRSTHTGTQTLATISDAGSAAGRDVAGGSGDLMAEGFAGLGAAGGPEFNIPGNDLNSASGETGFFRYDVATLNRPPSEGAGTGIVILWSGGVQTQALTDSYPNSVAGQQWSRALKGNGEWGPMRMQYDSHNILGTVSQSDGVPTGALFERGSNANGEYVKFADGTLECWVKAFATIATGVTPWTFPVAVVDSAKSSIQITKTGNSFLIPERSGGLNNNVQLALRDSVGNYVAGSVDIELKGRWY